MYKVKLDHDQNILYLFYKSKIEALDANSLKVVNDIENNGYRNVYFINQESNIVIF